MTPPPRIMSDDVAVPMPDGVRLATDVTVPDDGLPHPTLLVRTPYGRGSARQSLDPLALARLGWSVVVQDVRGRWDSDGSFQPFRHERDDGVATVAWCRAQPWSDGNVAMAGGSYVGITQWLAAAGKPAGLRALAPAVAITDLRDDGVYEGGGLQLGLFSAWLLGIGALGNRLDAQTAAESLAQLDSWPAVLDKPIWDGVLARIVPEGTAWLAYDRDDYWEPLDVAAGLPDLDVAVHHLVGWHDIFCEGGLRAYTSLTGDGRAETVGRRQRLVVGPWAHATVLQRRTGHLDFGVAVQGDFSGIPAEQLEFLTRATTGQDVVSGARVFVMGSNRWIELPGWPPASTPMPLYLSGDGASHESGRLLWQAPPAAGEDHYRHDPATPVPTSGGRILHPGIAEPGPLDQRQVEERADVLVYTSEVLGGDVTILGAVRAHLAFASTAPVADVTVKLVDVHPDGRAMLVVDSIRRSSGPPGEPREVVVEIGSTGLTFQAGHRIRIEVASSNFPRFDLSPAAGQTVYHGGDPASRLVLPVYAGQV